MSKFNGIRKLLGITQEQLAILLGISRSTLSLYELGKRNLPIEAKIKLTQLLAQSQSLDLMKDKSNSHLTKDKSQLIQKLIQKNQIEINQLQKKLVLFQKKKIKNEARNKLFEYLNEVQNPDIKKEIYLFKSFKNETTTKTSTKILISIFELEIKLELLFKEQKALKTILQRF